MSKEAEVKHFIQMSTIAVYGNVDCITEDTNVNPVTLYGKSKLKADIALTELESEDFKVTSIRPPMVYGGGIAPGNMMRLVNLTYKGVYVPFGNINNVRDFINVDNLLDCIEVIINNTIGGVIIPTDREPVSTEVIIQTICKVAVLKPKLIVLPKVFLRLIKLLKPSIYNKVFGSLTVKCNIDKSLYSPKHSTEEGIKEMVIAYKNNKK